MYIQFWEHIQEHTQAWGYKQAHIQGWEHQQAHIIAHTQVSTTY